MNIQYLSDIMKKKYLLEKNTSYQRTNDLEVHKVLSGTIIPMEKVEIINTKSFFIIPKEGMTEDMRHELRGLLNKKIDKR